MRIILFSFLVLFASCDPMASSNYYIENNTDNQVMFVINQKYKPIIDTNILSKNNKVLIFDQSRRGGSVEEFLSEAILPIDTFKVYSINNNDTNVYIGNVKDLNNWTKHKDINHAIITLDLQNEDF